MLEKLIFRCGECGHSKEILDNLDNIDKEDCFCCMCGSEMDLQDVKNGISVSDVVSLDNITQMKKNISELGNDKTWNIIEDLKNAKTRIAYRNIFFNAGGYVPEQGGKLK